MVIEVLRTIKNVTDNSKRYKYLIFITLRVSGLLRSFNGWFFTSRKEGSSRDQVINAINKGRLLI